MAEVELGDGQGSAGHDEGQGDEQAEAGGADGGNSLSKSLEKGLASAGARTFQI